MRWYILREENIGWTGFSNALREDAVQTGDTIEQ